MAPPADPIAVRVWRGDLVESEHRAVASVWRGDTRIGSIGDVERRHFPRSAAKPFQALASLTILDAEGFALRDEERAVIASSHAGEPLHTELITGLLARAGLDGTHLRCGAHAPFAEEAARALVRSRAAPTALHHNCSGKHAAMLIASKLRGWDLASYRDAGHPIQVRCRDFLARFAGLEPSDLGHGVDGCGVPAFHLPLDAMARAYGRLAAVGSVAEVPEAPWRALLAAIARAPRAFGGTGRLSTRFVEVTEGRVIVKEGAEGYLGFAVPSEGLGGAFKVLDGAARAVGPLAAALMLRHVADLGNRARAELGALRRAPIVNFTGTEVGRIEARID